MGVRRFVVVTRSSCLVLAICVNVHPAHNARGRRRRPDPPELSAPGAKAYLATEDLKLPEYATSAFIPGFVGPYRILKADPSTSTYKCASDTTLALPDSA